MAGHTTGAQQGGTAGIPEDRQTAYRQLKGALFDLRAGAGGLFRITGATAAERVAVMDAFVRDLVKETVTLVRVHCLPGEAVRPHAVSRLLFDAYLDRFANYPLARQREIRDLLPPGIDRLEPLLADFNRRMPLLIQAGGRPRAPAGFIRHQDLSLSRILLRLVVSLVGAEGRLILLFDHIDQADAASLELLADLCQEAAHHPVLIGLTASDDHAWPASLAPSSNPDAWSLIRLAGEDTAGAPGQGAAHLLAALDEADRDCLAFAALLGAVFDQTMLEDIAGWPRGQPCFGRAALAGLLTAADGPPPSWGFPHEGLRQELIARIPEARRREWHQRIAARYAAQEAGGPDRDFICAHHFRAAGMPDWAAPFALAAAESAMRTHAWDEAVSLLDGVRQTAEPPLAWRAGILAAQVFVNQGRYPDARAVLEPLLRELPAAARPEALKVLSLAHLKSGDFRACEEAGRAGLEQTGDSFPHGFGALILHCLVSLAALAVYLVVPRPRRAGTGGRQARTRVFLLGTLARLYALQNPPRFLAAVLRMRSISARRLRGRVEEGVGLAVCGMAAMMVRWRGIARHYLRASLRFRQAIGDVWGIAQSRQLIGTSLLWEGRLQPAIHHLRRAADEFMTIGEISELCTTIIPLAEAHLLRGDRAAACACLDDAEKWAGRTSDSFSLLMAASLRALAVLEYRDAALVGPAAREVIGSACRTGEPYARCIALQAAGALALAEGNPPAARDLLAQARALQAVHRFRGYYAGRLCLLEAQAEWLCGDSPAGRRVGSRLGEARAWPTHRAQALRLRAWLDARQGRMGAAAAGYQVCIRYMGSLGMVYGQASVQEALAAVQLDRGRRVAAETRLEAACRGYLGLGAVRPACRTLAGLIALEGRAAAELRMSWRGMLLRQLPRLDSLQSAQDWCRSLVAAEGLEIDAGSPDAESEIKLLQPALEPDEVDRALMRAVIDQWLMRGAAPDPDRPAGGTSATDKRVVMAMEIMKKQFQSDLGRDSLAELVGCNPDYLGKVFKAQTGMRIADYLSYLRVQEATRLLRHSTDPIVDIAYRLGFESLRTFNRAFLAHTGCSPSAWREGGTR